MTTNTVIIYIYMYVYIYIYMCVCVSLSQVYDSTSAWELMHMFQISFVCILCYRMLECSIRYIIIYLCPFYIYIYIYIYAHNELISPASDSTKCKQTKFCTYEIIPSLTLSLRLGREICHQPDVKLGRFQSQLGESHVSSHTEELWYNKKNLFADVYVYMCIIID